MSDLLQAALLQQTRQRPRQSASSRLAEQLMRQAGQQGPVYGTLGVLSRALPGVLGAYMAQRGDREERAEEEARFGRIENMAREQRDEAANFFRPGGMPAQAPQAPAQPPMMPSGGDTPQAPAAPSAVPQRTPGGASWLDRLETAESGGNPNARNPRSTATGNFQFIDGTWREFAAANPTLFQGMSPEQVMAARTDPALGRRAAEWYAGRNAEALRAAGLEPTEANLALAHRFGAAGAAAVLRGDPQAGVASTVPNGAQTLIANPDLRGRSNADVIAQYGRLVTGGSPAMPQAAVPGTAANMPTAGVPNGNPAPIPNAAQPPGMTGLPPGVTMERLQEGLRHRNPEVRREAEAIARTIELLRRNNPPETFTAPITETGPDGQPVVVRYGSRGARVVIDGARPEAPRAGLNPLPAYDSEGNPTVLLPRTDGTLAQPQLPEGVTLTPRTREINTGTEILTVDQGGRIVERRPIDIAGREREERIGERQGTEIAAAPGAVRTADQSIALIDNVLNHRALRSATGVLSFTGAIPGTPQFDFAQRVAQLQGRAFLEAFESLRGGGAITEIEGRKATEAMARLSRNASAADFRAALQELRDIMDDARERAAARIAPQGGRATGPTPGSTAESPPGPGTQAQPPAQRFRFNPATGAVEPAQ